MMNIEFMCTDIILFMKCDLTPAEIDKCEKLKLFFENFDSFQ